MAINQASGNYNDLGFYYEFQNLNLGQLATGGYSITITGATSTYGVNFYVNPQDWNWGPTSNAGIEKFATPLATGLGTDGSYGLGPSHSAIFTINSATSFTNFQGKCTGTLTVAQLVSTCGLSASTPFALWIGVGPISPGTVTATIDSVSSSPYP